MGLMSTSRRSPAARVDGWRRLPTETWRSSCTPTEEGSPPGHR
jgi:hypothetical protein